MFGIYCIAEDTESAQIMTHSRIIHLNNNRNGIGAMKYSSLGKDNV